MAWAWSEGQIRLPVDERLEAANKIYSEVEVLYSYQIELQEFMNFLTMPQLKLDRYGGSTWKKWTGNKGDHTYDLEFTLPQFQLGISEIVCGVYSASGFDTTNGQIEIMPDQQATELLVSAVQTALNEPARAYYDNGALQLHVQVDFLYRVNLFWYYQPCLLYTSPSPRDA